MFPSHLCLLLQLWPLAGSFSSISFCASTSGSPLLGFPGPRTHLQPPRYASPLWGGVIWISFSRLLLSPLLWAAFALLVFVMGVVLLDIRSGFGVFCLARSFIPSCILIAHPAGLPSPRPRSVAPIVCPCLQLSIIYNTLCCYGRPATRLHGSLSPAGFAVVFRWDLPPQREASSVFPFFTVFPSVCFGFAVVALVSVVGPTS